VMGVGATPAQPQALPVVSTTRPRLERWITISMEPSPLSQNPQEANTISVMLL
jgi:hypothetical protein